jgi:hypothetical protein
MPPPHLKKLITIAVYQTSLAIIPILIEEWVNKKLSPSSSSILREQ